MEEGAALMGFRQANGERKARSDWPELLLTTQQNYRRLDVRTILEKGQQKVGGRAPGVCLARRKDGGS